MENKNNIFQSIFFFCSGVDVRLLTGKYKKFETPLYSEYNKYIGIGTSVLFTSIFAMLSAMFALSYLEGLTSWFVVLGGIFWGLNIFFLDRYIVATMRKENNKKMNEFYQAIPRILIGLIFAFTIAIPMEISLFNGKIMAELEEYNQRQIQENENKYKENARKDNDALSQIDKNVDNKIDQQNKEMINLKSQKEEIQKQINSLLTQINNNTIIIRSNTYPNSKYPLESNIPYFLNGTAQQMQYINQQKQAEINQQQVSLNKVDKSIMEFIETHKKELEDIKEKNKEKKKPFEQTKSKNQKDSTNVSNYAEVMRRSTDLLARHEALSRLAEKDWNIRAATWLVTLLFIAIELSPIISKLITKKGLYDERLEAIESQERMVVSKENNLINQGLLDIENENNIQIEERMLVCQKINLKNQTQIIEVENIEKKKQDLQLEKLNMEFEKERLFVLQEKKPIVENIKAAEEAIEVSLKTIQSSADAEKSLRQRLAKYIEDKQHSLLKQQIDDFFESQKK